MKALGIGLPGDETLRDMAKIRLHNMCHLFLCHGGVCDLGSLNDMFRVNVPL